jgi:hypothetical protein
MTRMPLGLSLGRSWRVRAACSQRVTRPAPEPKSGTAPGTIPACSAAAAIAFIADAQKIRLGWIISAVYPVTTLQRQVH